MKKMNKKGFTLIELLAVIIILGILMIIAIPSVTSYIQNSRKSAYADTAVQYADAVLKEVNSGRNLKLYSSNTLYLIPVGNEKANSCVSLESGGQSPFGDKWRYAYVGVSFDGDNANNHYYFIGEDDAGQGIAFIDKKTLTDDGSDYIYSSYATIDATSVTEKHTKITSEFADYLAAKYTGGATATSNTEIVKPEEGWPTEYDSHDDAHMYEWGALIASYVEGKETGKSISKILIVESKDCKAIEKVTANLGG